MALATLVVTAGAMGVTGFGTGAGPLGNDGGATIGIHRASPAVFTTGLNLRHSGWFDVHLESIRPIPRGDAARGMPLRELSLTSDPSGADVGVLDGAAEAHVPRSALHPAKGFLVPPSDETPGAIGAVGLATFEIVESGMWRYDGFEVVYRHGVVRHRAVIGLNVVGCPPDVDLCGQG